jgi:hypothetical protein
VPITISINQGKDFEALSEGLHTLILADVVDLGIQETSFGPKHKIRFVYLSDEADSEGRTKYVFEKFTRSLHEKSRLRPRVKELLGRDLSGDELKAFDIETLIGSQRQAIIEHSEDKDGNTWANVKAFMKGAAPVKLTIPADFTRDKDKPADKRKGKYEAPKVGGGKAAAAAILKPADDPNFDPFN